MKVTGVCECCEEYPAQYREIMPSGFTWQVCHPCGLMVYLGAVTNLGEIIDTITRERETV